MSDETFLTANVGFNKPKEEAKPEPEEVTEEKELQVGDRRPRRRRHKRSMNGRPPEIVRNLIDRLEAMEKRNDQLQTALLASQKGQPAQNLFFPPEPDEVPIPRGFEFNGKTISENEETAQGDKRSVFSRKVPHRADDYNQPDPRFCIYCSKQSVELTLKANANVCKMYGYDNIGGAPTPEEEQIIRRLHIQHMEAARAMKNSDSYLERRYYADHFDMKWWPVGPMKNEVMFRSSGRRDGENISYTAEQLNEIRKKEHQARCNAIVMNRAR